LRGMTVIKKAEGSGGTEVAVVLPPTTQAWPLRVPEAVGCQPPDAFAHLGMGDEQITAYLSDAKERLTRGAPWQLNPTGGASRLLRLQNRHNPQFMMECDAQEASSKDALGHKVVAYRHRVHRMAVTLAECFQFATEGKTDMVSACYDDISILEVEVRELFCECSQAISKEIDKVTSAATSHMETSLRNEGSQVFASSLAQAGTFLGFMVCILLAVALFSPGRIESLGYMANQWYAPVTQTPTGVILYAPEGKTKLSARWAMASLAFCWAAYVSVIRLRWAARKREADAKLHHQLAQIAACNGTFLDVNKEMWRGMQVWVEDVANSIKVLKELHPERVALRRSQLHDIAHKVFGMSMAVDEYIFWLNRHNSFPANFSIRNLLTPARYDRIKSIADAMRPEGHV